VTLWPHPLDDGRAEERTAMLLWLADNGQAEEALRRLPRVETAHPEPALLLYRLGVALDENGRAADAVPLLERAARAGSVQAGGAQAGGRPEIELALGQALLDAGRPSDAAPHLRAAWRAGTRADVAGFDLSRALAASGNGAAAAAVLAELAERTPPADGESAHALASVSLELHRPELALRFADAGLAQRPDAPALLEKRGLALAMLSRAADADAALRRAATLDAKSASIRLNLAVVEAQLGRVESARSLAREALALDPGYAQARGLLEALERVR
jgi:tetratricopeptide (TPR) repeat protein